MASCVRLRRSFQLWAARAIPLNMPIALRTQPPIFSGRPPTNRILSMSIQRPSASSLPRALTTPEGRTIGDVERRPMSLIPDNVVGHDRVGAGFGAARGRNRDVVRVRAVAGDRDRVAVRAVGAGGRAVRSEGEGGAQ